MTIAQAEDYFVKEGYQPKLSPFPREARHIRPDLRVRHDGQADDSQAARGLQGEDGRAVLLQKFDDTFISLGPLPLPLIRRRCSARSDSCRGPGKAANETVLRWTELASGRGRTIRRHARDCSRRCVRLLLALPLAVVAAQTLSRSRHSRRPLRRRSPPADGVRVAVRVVPRDGWRRRNRRPIWLSERSGTAANRPVARRHRAQRHPGTETPSFAFAPTIGPPGRRRRTSGRSAGPSPLGCPAIRVAAPPWTRPPAAARATSSPAAAQADRARATAHWRAPWSGRTCASPSSTLPQPIRPGTSSCVP